MQSKQIIMSPFEFDNTKFFGIPLYVYQLGEKYTNIQMNAFI